VIGAGASGARTWNRRGAEPLAEGIGFLPDELHEGFVFHTILARRLKFSPQALDPR
jgi:hypothetical protein